MTQLPRLAMLRELTDRAVLDRVYTDGRTTRAELATATGISKPTISESVRRLEAAGVLRATGDDLTGRRGRIATFYELAEDAGNVLAVELDQRGVHTLVADLTGATLAEHHRGAGHPGDSDALAVVLREAVREAVATTAASGGLRAIALSVAGPVDPHSRRVITLPDSPFPEGGLQPRDALAGLTTAPVLADNDVNLSALAERRIGAGKTAHSFAYVYLGAGLGMSLHLGDQLIRGAHGLAGEIGYLNTGTGSLAAAIAEQGFGRRDAPSLDVDAILAVLAGRDEAAIGRLGATIGQAIATTCTVFDPELVLLGGPVGSRPELLEPIRAAVARIVPTPVRVEPGALGESAGLTGALLSALDTAREQLLANAQS